MYQDDHRNAQQYFLPAIQPKLLLQNIMIRHIGYVPKVKVRPCIVVEEDLALSCAQDAGASFVMRLE